jgi:hypothetical protein
MPYKPIPVAPLMKGIAAETDPYSQPKGTVPRASNFLWNKRGACDVCDGSQLVHAFNGAVQSSRGKVMADFLFNPTGVSSYYLALIKVLDIPLGAPQNLTASAGTGGNLAAGTYYYKVTAIDGAGGETTASNVANATVAANGKITLAVNVVPNAQSYNIYRSGFALSQTLIYPSTPFLQAASGQITASFVDDGTAATGFSDTISLMRPYFSSTTIAEMTLVGLVASHYIIGSTFFVVGASPFQWNQTYTVLQLLSSNTVLVKINSGTIPSTPTTTGLTSTNTVSAPNSDNTQQTALFQMPVIPGAPATLPTSYNNANIVALFPADIQPNPDGGGGGGSGGGGGTGGGGSSGGGASTPSGGTAGNVSFIPQMVQFTNRVAIALGNGFPPQLFSDSTGTPTNPATAGAITTITVDAFGVVTVTVPTGHGLSVTPSQAGGNVIIAGVSNSAFNYVGPTIAVVSSTQYKVRNLAAIGQVGSGGTSTTTSLPIISTFVPGFPTWATAVAYSQNSVVTPTVSNGHYYTAKQGGVSGGSQPSFPTGTGAQVADGSIIWQEAGLVNTAAPPPPGCGHITVYAGSLWMLNTSPTNTATGIDGPCSLRMSDVNNPNSYNPINQAFLDKDDGTEGTALSSFTIAAQGIPPEGSLIAAKNYAAYQIIGVFGSTNLTIQRTRSDMGCISPRTMQFVPGFGIVRYTHLGFAVFDGVEDRIISEDVRPFLFPTEDYSEQDITVLDASWQSVMWGFQTASPPMFCVAAPIGQSGGQLTRLFCYDLVLKAWAIVDLPFAISTASQFKTISANPVTIFGGFSDGLLSRWQAGDQMWDVGATGARSPSNVTWSVKLPDVAAQIADTKLNCRRLAIRGINTTAVSPITVTPFVNGVAKSSQNYAIPASGDFEVFASYMLDGLRFSAIISGNGQLELDRFSFHVSEKAAGTAKVIS